MPVHTATEKTDTRLFQEEALSSRGKAQQDAPVFRIQRLLEVHRDNFAVQILSNYRPSDASMLFGFSATMLENSWSDMLVLEATRIEDEASPRSAHLSFAALSPSEFFAPTGRGQLLSKSIVVPTVNPLDVSRQLAALKDLEDGWADGVQLASQWGEGYGKAPSAEGVDWLAARFAASYAANLPRPYLYPTPEGGVQAEWTLGAYEASLEIDLAVHSAEWHCLNHYTWQSDERPLDLNEAAAWEWLDNELRRLGSDTESLKGANEAVMRGERPARRFMSQADLRKFFEYTNWAAGPGPEPDWSESLRILQESQLKGLIEP